jgi:hypothetical protein
MEHEGYKSKTPALKKRSIPPLDVSGVTLEVAGQTPVTADPGGRAVAILNIGGVDGGVQQQASVSTRM